MQIRPYLPTDEPAVVQLWERAGLTRPWNNPQLDIARKLAVQADGFLVGLLDDRVIATVMAGYDGHRGWINYLAVDPRHQRAGYGRLMMDRAEQLLHELGCPKINLQIRTDNAAAIAFYEQLGFTKDAVISLGKRLIPDE